MLALMIPIVAVGGFFAWMISLSIISSAAGTIPAAMIPDTVLVASSTPSTRIT